MQVSLRQIWIMQDSGTCLYHRKFDDSNNDENLISGFLSAVNSFVGSFGSEIKWIETNNKRFVFKICAQTIFVACTDTNDHAPLTHKRLERISEYFHIMFKNSVFQSGDPIPIDIFRKIAPTVTRIFGISNETNDPLIKKPQIVNRSSFQFDTAEARLMSFVRYKRRVSISEVMRYLKISNNDAETVLKQLEKKSFIQRVEDPDGTERIGLHPVAGSSFK